MGRRFFLRISRFFNRSIGYSIQTFTAEGDCATRKRNISSGGMAKNWIPACAGMAQKKQQPQHRTIGIAIAIGIGIDFDFDTDCDTDTDSDFDFDFDSDTDTDFDFVGWLCCVGVIGLFDLYPQQCYCCVHRVVEDPCDRAWDISA